MTIKIIFSFLFFLLTIQSEASVEDSLEPYKNYLDDGTHEGQGWPSSETIPKSRYYTFKESFNYLEENEGPIVVELGTSRSFTHGGLIGCNSDDISHWTINQPENWDWGAGFFTRMACLCLGHLSPEIHTVDIVSSHIERCKIMTKDYEDLLSYHVMSSVDFLKHCAFPGGIDLLYLDTGDIRAL